MTLETFKDIHKDKTPFDKVNLLREQTANAIFDVLSKEEALKRNDESDAKFWKKESVEMGKRMDWLFDELRFALKEQ